ncbi:MAG: hypothetical protein AB7Q16_24130 [Vicinamibacterales bacterium]
MTVGPVATTHPKAGSKLAAPPPAPSAKVKAILGKLADLPAEAEARALTEADLRKALAEKDRELARLRRQASQPVSEKCEKPAERVEVLTDADRAQIGQLSDRIAATTDRLTAFVSGHVATAEAAIVLAVRNFHADVGDAVEKARADFEKRLESKGLERILDKLDRVTVAPATAKPAPNYAAIMPTRGIARRNADRSPSGDLRVSGAAGTDETVRPAQQKILNALAFLHGIGVASANKTQLALLVGVSPTSGGYFNNLGSLRSRGLIEYPAGGTVALTDAGTALASTAGVPATTAELHDAIRQKLPPAKWKVLEPLIACYPRALAKDALAAQIGVSPTSGGYFNNLGSLRSLGLLDYPQPGTVVAADVLFLKG